MSGSTTISNLPAASSAGSTDKIPVDQTSGGSTVTRAVTVQQLAAAIGGGGETITSAALQTALITLLLSLNTAPTAGTPTLWNNSGVLEYS